MHLFSTRLFFLRCGKVHFPGLLTDAAHAGSRVALATLQRVQALTQAVHKTMANAPSRRGFKPIHCWVVRSVVLALVMAVLLAVPLASTLGLLHRTSHGLPGDGTGAKTPNAFKSVPAASAGISTNINTGFSADIAQLLPAHAAEADCLLFDQLCHTGSPSQAAQPLPLLPVLFFFLDFYGADARVIWPAPFHARGPPITR